MPVRVGQNFRWSVSFFLMLPFNAGEIGAIAGSSEVKARGVDSVGAGFKDPSSVVKNLARRESVPTVHSSSNLGGIGLRLTFPTELVVAMSGAVDYVSDGTTTYAIHNGHQYQSVITGSGCMASTFVCPNLLALRFLTPVHPPDP